MSPSYVTNFVVLCLSVTLFVACKDKPSPYQKTLAEGASSKAGEALTSKAWCSETKTDGKGQISVNRFSFRSDKELVITRLQLQSDNSLVPIVQETGSWALIGDQLFIRSDAEPQMRQFAVTQSTRESDQTDCMDINAAGATDRLCPCTN